MEGKGEWKKARGSANGKLFTHRSFQKSAAMDEYVEQSQSVLWPECQWPRLVVLARVAWIVLHFCLLEFLLGIYVKKVMAEFCMFSVI